MVHNFRMVRRLSEGVRIPCQAHDHPVTLNSLRLTGKAIIQGIRGMLAMTPRYSVSVIDMWSKYVTTYICYCMAVSDSEDIHACGPDWTGYSGAWTCGMPLYPVRSGPHISPEKIPK
jgi:hypothetical protein